jgi:hypothetical protein
MVLYFEILSNMGSVFDFHVILSLLSFFIHESEP